MNLLQRGLLCHFLDSETPSAIFSAHGICTWLRQVSQDLRKGDAPAWQETLPGPGRRDVCSWAHPAPGSAFRQAQDVSLGQWGSPFAEGRLPGTPAPACFPAGVKSLLTPMHHRDCFPVSCLEGSELGRPTQKALTPGSLTGGRSLGRVEFQQCAQDYLPRCEQSQSPERCLAPPSPSLA